MKIIVNNIDCGSLIVLNLYESPLDWLPLAGIEVTTSDEILGGKRSTKTNFGLEQLNFNSRGVSS